jgi:hypothetical protein
MKDLGIKRSQDSFGLQSIQILKGSFSQFIQSPKTLISQPYRALENDHALQSIRTDAGSKAKGRPWRDSAHVPQKTHVLQAHQSHTCSVSRSPNKSLFLLHFIMGK